MQDLTPSRESLDPIEIASRDEITALQQRRMAKTLAHAYANSPFYKKAFDDHGVHPDDFKTITDIAKFPFTLKTDLPFLTILAIILPITLFVQKLV